MQVFYDIGDVKKDLNTYLTLGTFDGVHIGHQDILKEVIRRSGNNSGRNFLVTFNPHPRLVLNSNSNKINILTTLEEKLDLLAGYGVENTLVVNFTKEFSQLSSETFIRDYLYGKIGIKDIIIGHDHQFGKDREGNKITLEKIGSDLGFKVDIIGPVSVGGQVISSTKIRHSLINGEMETASKYLGRPYSFQGKVIQGDKRGRTLGFPTANIFVESEKLLPKNGIYAGRILIDGQIFEGVMSIGVRPTFYSTAVLLPEFHIFNFDRDVYGKNVKVEIIKYIREERKYNFIEDLISQIKIDVISAVEILKNYKE